MTLTKMNKYSLSIKMKNGKLIFLKPAELINTKVKYCTFCSAKNE
jgi:hypothetical protein